MTEARERNDFCVNFWAVVVDRVEEAIQSLSSLPNQLQLQKKLEVSKKFASEHPMMTLFMLVTVAMCSVPVMCFIAFACGSMFLSFTAFIVVEGFLLTVGSVVLGGVMCFVGLFALLLSSLLATAWISFGLCSRLLHSARDHVNVRFPHKEKTSHTNIDMTHDSTRSSTTPTELLKDMSTEKD